MTESVFPRMGRTIVAGIVLVSLSLTVPASAGLIQVRLERYVVSAGVASENYFNGKLLTAQDLNREQSYQRSRDRYIGETEKNIDAVLRPVGVADVTLLLDEAEALLGTPTEVEDSNHRFLQDFVVLDLEQNTWRGRLYLDEHGDVLPGIYDDLSGTFADFLQVPAPHSPATLLVVALAGLLWLRKVRVRANGR